MIKHNYLNLTIWKESIDFTILIYQTTSKYNEQEKFGLVNQMRRASNSIACNIAEGSRRTSNKDFNRFLGIAQGSLAEVHTQLVISDRLGIIETKIYKKLEEKIERLKNMIYKFQMKISNENS